MEAMKELLKDREQQVRDLRQQVQELEASHDNER